MNSKNKQINPLSIIHIALTLGASAFLLMAYISQTTLVFDYSSGDIFLILGPLLAITTVGISNILFKKQLREVEKQNNEQDKLKVYTTASILRFAPLEAGSLFNSGLFIISGNLMFALISILILFYLGSLHPTKTRIKKDLNHKPNSGAISRK